MTQRTNKQNNSLHRYCDQMANDLEAAGFDQTKFYELLKDGFSLPWTMEAFKGFFRTVAADLYPEVESTADLTTEQIQRVYEVIDRGVSEKTGVRHDWPSEDSLYFQQHGMVR